MKRLSLLVHAMAAMAAVSANVLLWRIFLAHGAGSFWEGTLRASTGHYFIPGVAFALAAGAGIPIALLSGLRAAQLLLPKMQWLSRWTWIRPSANAVLVVVFLAFLFQFPEDDLLADPIRDFAQRMTCAQAEKLAGPALRSDAEVGFPALPLVPEKDLLAQIELTGMDGQPLKLGDLRGKAVFLNFWATWCGPCRAEMPNIENLYQALKEEPEVAFVLVSRETPETVKSFLEKAPHTTPIYIASEEAVQPLHVSALPTTMILSKSGEIAFRKMGAAAWDAGTTKAFLLALARDLPFTPPEKDEKEAAPPQARLRENKKRPQSHS